jgi:hypothetical protein
MCSHLLACDPEDLKRFAVEFTADIRRGQRRAGPVDNTEYGSRLDLGDHLLQGALAPAETRNLLIRCS